MEVPHKKMASRSDLPRRNPSCRPRPPALLAKENRGMMGSPPGCDCSVNWQGRTEGDHRVFISSGACKGGRIWRHTRAKRELRAGLGGEDEARARENQPRSIGGSRRKPATAGAHGFVARALTGGGGRSRAQLSIANLRSRNLRLRGGRVIYRRRQHFASGRATRATRVCPLAGEGRESGPHMWIGHKIIHFTKLS